jgi:hypothetical protein
MNMQCSRTSEGQLHNVAIATGCWRPDYITAHPACKSQHTAGESKVKSVSSGPRSPIHAKNGSGASLLVARKPYLGLVIGMREPPSKPKDNFTNALAVKMSLMAAITIRPTRSTTAIVVHRRLMARHLYLIPCQRSIG